MFLNEYFSVLLIEFFNESKSAKFIRKMNKKCIFGKMSSVMKTAHLAWFSLFSQTEIIFPIWMNNFIKWIVLILFEWIIFLNEYLWFNFELNIELNNFSAQFNAKMNNQSVSLTPIVNWVTTLSVAFWPVSVTTSSLSFYYENYTNWSNASHAPQRGKKTNTY